MIDNLLLDTNNDLQQKHPEHISRYLYPQMHPRNHKATEVPKVHKPENPDVFQGQSNQILQPKKK